MRTIFVHIPKTGGVALWSAIEDVEGVEHWAHDPVMQFYKSRVVGEAQYVTILRDPVARFISACAFRRRRLKAMGWDNAEQVALALPESLSDEATRIQLFWPQVHWVQSASRLQQPDVLMVLRTETLDEDFERLKPLLGIPSDRRLPDVNHHLRNASKHDGPLSSEAEARVRAAYAEDVEMLEALAQEG